PPENPEEENEEGEDENEDEENEQCEARTLAPQPEFEVDQEVLDEILASQPEDGEEGEEGGEGGEGEDGGEGPLPTPCKDESECPECAFLGTPHCESAEGAEEKTCICIGGEDEDNIDGGGGVGEGGEESPDCKEEETEKCPECPEGKSKFCGGASAAPVGEDLAEPKLKCSCVTSATSGDDAADNGGGGGLDIDDGKLDPGDDRFKDGPIAGKKRGLYRKWFEA
ncbi:MAG: hypothetical protein Q9198_009762, partial [Flavoplaca austrocitrina]